MKKTDIFHNPAQSIYCGYSLEPPRWGGSNEYPHSMLLSRNKKNNVYPCRPQFYYIKVGFKGVRIIWACFPDEALPIKPPNLMLQILSVLQYFKKYFPEF